MTLFAGGRVLEPRTKAYLAMEGNAEMSNYLAGYSSTFPTTGIQPTMTTAEKVIRTEIDRREKELASLRQALAALSGGAKTGKGRAATGKRRPKTAAEKKLLSAKMKAAWKRRKAAEKSAAK